MWVTVFEKVKQQQKGNETSDKQLIKQKYNTGNSACSNK